MKSERVRLLEILAFARELERERKGGLTAILKAQERNFRNLLRHAYTNIPFYRKLYGKINPDSVELEDLPPITKSQLMREFSDTLLARGISIEEVKEFASRLDTIGQLFKGRYIVLHTSGSTGERGYFLLDIPSWQRLHAIGFARQKRMLKFPIRYFLAVTPFFKVRVALVIPTGGHFGSLLLPKISPAIWHYVSEHYEIDILKPEQEIISELNRIKPHHIHTYPTFAEVLVENWEAGKLNFKPFSLSVSSESFSHVLREKILRAFGDVLIVEIYASTEVLHIAKSCVLGRLHLAADWVIVEPVTTDGKPVGLGESSEKIFITNLFNYFQPLIRYEMTDSVRISPTPCECGEPLPVIEVIGRTNSVLTLLAPDGKKIRLLPTPILVAFLEVPHLKKYQIVHERQNRLLVRYIPDEDGKEKIVESAIIELLKKYLNRHGIQSGVEIVPQKVSEIPRDPVSHKITQIVDITN